MTMRASCSTVGIAFISVALAWTGAAAADVATKKPVIINQAEPITIVGIELKTSNDRADAEIPLHWEKFYREAVFLEIPNKLSRDVYAVYTNFANPGKNNQGVYSFIIGAQVASADRIPDRLVATVIPRSKRRVFTVTTGHPELVTEKWREVWALPGLKKTFIADYERYRESGEIDIFVGIK